MSVAVFHSKLPCFDFVILNTIRLIRSNLVSCEINVITIWGTFQIRVQMFSDSGDVWSDPAGGAVSPVSCVWKRSWAFDAASPLTPQPARNASFCKHAAAAAEPASSPQLRADAEMTRGSFSCWLTNHLQTRRHPALLCAKQEARQSSSDCWFGSSCL